ncbi:divergent polysaccharide deacetylase family protein [Marinimicrobium locisalis]|uniref:divergent polysaccharide deacetylase family protein n=1 Tax=Marinimicrobium locisalis TaxID=546022 RepID=UPI0032215403
MRATPAFSLRPARWLALLALLLSIGARGEAQLAIIIDDIGYSAALGERSLGLEGAFTYAVLPRAPHGPRLARLGAQSGKEIILHNPMSNTRGLPLDAGALSEAMPHADFTATLQDNLAAIPEARGLNNHMGSLLTQSPQAMGWIMQVLGDHDLYFIDSRTSANSQAWETARHYGVPSLKRDVFLDNERDIKKIARQVAKAIELARERGYALAIGHPYPETLTVLEQIQPTLEAANVSLVPVSTLLKRPEHGPRAEYRSCLAPPMTLWRHPSGAREKPAESPWPGQSLRPLLPTTGALR